MLHMHLDTAVIGGGVSGLFTCLSLREKFGPDHKIALFEASSRLGGRIETVDMDGFLAEFGPMRFERKAQPLLMNLIASLGLETSHFPPYMAAPGFEALFNLDEDRSAKHTDDPARLFNALELLTLGILRILGQSGGDLDDPRDPRHCAWWGGLDEDYYAWVRREARFNGALLRETGLWNVLSDVLSHKAVETIKDCGTFYHVIHHNPNAAEWINFWLRGLHPYDALVGIKQGTEALIRALAQKLESPAPVPLYLNHRLTALARKEDGRVDITLETPDGPLTATARHAVLALPQSPLRRLAPQFPERIARLIEAVIPVPLFKCFYVTKAPWWDDKTPPQTRALATPARELHYYYRQEGDDRRGMVMVYGDKPTLSYWRVYVENEKHEAAELNGDARLLDRYLKYLSHTPGSEDPEKRAAEIKAITCYGIRDWSRTPYEAGCHVWKPGQNVEEAVAALAAFSLDAAPAPKNVHICGEAYSDFQGFIEGALRSALLAVDRIEG